MTPAPRSPRQTLSYLRQLFEERGIRPKNKMGQSFLIDLNLVDLLVRAAELTADDLALEVGGGTGSLTALLAREAGAVVTVELDNAFADLIREVVADHGDRVVLVHADVLKGKNELNPDVLAVLREQAAKHGTKRLKLTANLPYAVATPVVSNLLLTDLDVERMVVTVQWEDAERLLASPGKKDYGALSVLVQSLAAAALARTVPPAVCRPRPAGGAALLADRPQRAQR